MSPSCQRYQRGMRRGAVPIRQNQHNPITGGQKMADIVEKFAR
jgi:hypothetical protein